MEQTVKKKFGIRDIMTIAAMIGGRRDRRGRQGPERQHS